MSQHLYGSPILMGDNTIPGVQHTDELKEVIPRIIKACLEFGLNPYPPAIELLTYDEISEVASYGGFPVRYPHWSFGMEYEEMSRGYENGQFRIYEMVVNCLELNAPVLTKNGTKAAHSVKKGDVVLHPNGEREVVAVERQPKKQSLVIKLNGLGKPIVCSEKHKWFVSTENGLDWKESKDLKKDDVIVGGDTFLLFQNNPCKIEWTNEKVLKETRPNIRHCVKPISPPKYMNGDLAELLGAVVGDGSSGVKSRENHISVAIDKKNTNYIKHIDLLFNSVFGMEVLEETHRESVDAITLCSKESVDFFDYIGYPKGSTYKTKRVPWSIFASSSEFRARFLRGFFDTDGYATDVLGCSGYNHDLICDVQLLLLEMGIFSVVNRRKNNDGEISVLHIQGKDSLIKFRDRIGFCIQYKQDGLNLLIGSANCSNRGLAVLYVQREIIRISKDLNITTYNNTSLGYSVKNMEKNVVGRNVLMSFIRRANKQKIHDFDHLKEIVERPMFAVESVENGEVIETIDIALSHDDHDFMAYGLITHNTNPSYLYCLDSNSLLDHVTVIAHALGHSHFFKNNIWFAKTGQNAMNELANHGTRIRRYMDRWGKEHVTSFIDKILSIDELVDPAAAWKNIKYQEPVIRDKKEYHFPRKLRLPVTEGQQHDYMDEWINTKEFNEFEVNRIKENEIKKELEIIPRADKDILGYLMNNAPLKPWQQDILAILYREALYFAPQGLTKMANEGFASWVDYNIMARNHWAGGGGIFDYAKHKMGVLGGKYSMNPYSVGFKLLLHIEEKWNKGRFGWDYDNCKDYDVKKNWDKKLGQGHNKVFDVCQHHNDLTLVTEYVDQEFIDKYELFVWEKHPDENGGFVYRIKSRNAKDVRQHLIQRYTNAGRPNIVLADPNYGGKKIFLMQHEWDGRILAPKYAAATLPSIWCLWNNFGNASKNAVAIATKTKNGDECLYVCMGQSDKDSFKMTRKEFEKYFA